MAALNIVNPYGTNSPLEGRMDFNQGVFLIGGRGTFTSTDATATTPPRMGSKVVWALATGSSNSGYVTHSIGADGTITWTRSVTTSGGEISFLAAYCG